MIETKELDSSWEYVAGDFQLFEKLCSIFTKKAATDVMSVLRSNRLKFLDNLSKEGILEFRSDVRYFPQYGITFQDKTIAIAVLTPVKRNMILQLEKT